MDNFGNNLNHLFSSYYYGDTKIKLYVSGAVYSHFELGFKIQM